MRSAPLENIPVMKPLVSVITISLNAEKFIEQTILSVLNQSYENIEYVVVDGDSTDRTVQIINKYRDRIDHFISEKDKGIADAMNKGVASAAGEYIIFLHADDYFYDKDSLAQALTYIVADIDILACNILYGKDLKKIKPRGFNFWFNFKQGVYHQGTICSRQLFDQLKGFDKSFIITMDYDFFLRSYQKGARLVKAPIVLSVMRDTGISSRKDWVSLKQRFSEEKKVHQKHCPSMALWALYKIYWALYMPYRFFMYGTKALLSMSKNR